MKFLYTIVSIRVLSVDDTYRHTVHPHIATCFRGSGKVTFMVHTPVIHISMIHRTVHHTFIHIWMIHKFMRRVINVAWMPTRYVHHMGHMIVRHLRSKGANIPNSIKQTVCYTNDLFRKNKEVQIVWSV